MLSDQELVELGIDTNVQPKAGSVMIHVPSLYEDTGGIEVPETARTARNYFGDVLRSNVTRKQCKVLGGYVPQPGDRVILSPEGGRLLNTKIPGVYLYPPRHIVALIPPGENLEPLVPEIERCRFCGSCRTGSDQAMILYNGVCPRCKRDRTGKYHDPDALEADVTDEEVAEFEALLDRERLARR